MRESRRGGNVSRENTSAGIMDPNDTESADTGQLAMKTRTPADGRTGISLWYRAAVFLVPLASASIRRTAQSPAQTVTTRAKTPAIPHALLTQQWPPVFFFQPDRNPGRVGLRNKLQPVVVVHPPREVVEPHPPTKINHLGANHTGRGLERQNRLCEGALSHLFHQPDRCCYDISDTVAPISTVSVYSKGSARSEVQSLDSSLGYQPKVIRREIGINVDDEIARYTRGAGTGPVR